MNAKGVPIAVINPGAPAESLESKQPEVDNGVAVAGKEGYFSREYMQREWDKLWTRSWLIAGIESDIQEVGDFFLFNIRDESIIVTRTEEGIKAFYNVCSHRGARLVWDERGNRKVFVCPFHSWSFHNNGTLRRITDEEYFKPEVVAHRPGLKPVHCDTLAGIVFINMDDKPEQPLKEAIGLPEGYLEAYR
ncbi:MAG: Rieske (2Fe-2S) protein, partial [Haliea sp.]|nr:Rieske (2Fe-2S) protein [Haliea sp.]